MGYFGNKITTLKKQLYPTGRAWKMFPDSYHETLHAGLLPVEEQAYNDALAIFNSLLPDNNNFTDDDATDWERRLGMITNPLVSLTNRKAAILRKLRAPYTNKGRGYYLNLERELQTAGFNVYVFENIFYYYPYTSTTLNPALLNPNILSQVQHNDFQHGGSQHGYYLNNICANHIDEQLDLNFDLGQNLRSTFFIGANPVGTYANVPATRKDEFRQLILKIKQVQTVAILFINYT
jgi:hypothetical protein